ncbi:peptidase [Paenibacillus sp. GCM10027626]|uniref:peptidase n=1 Tax=Paenibacillus sp. GCM10027626 TaxID=3273411 RepID=UPI003640D248
MKKKTLSVLVVYILATVLITSTVFANTQSDPYKTSHIYDGYSYEFISQVRVGWAGTSKATVEATARVSCQEGNTKVGYMGGQARLFNESGNLAAASTFEYNTSAVATFFVNSPTIKTAGKYYSQSKGRFYNGDGYTEFTGYKSPIQQFDVPTLTSTINKSVDITADITPIMLLSEYGVNDNGETYGSALSEYSIGVEPDLVSAIGTNGVEGYVRATDLAPNVLSPDEVIEYMNEKGNSQTIPLYADNGTTVLGEFVLESHYTVMLDAE